MASKVRKSEVISANAARPEAKQFRFGYLVHDVHRIRRIVMDHAMRPLGLTRSQWSVLSTLSRSSNDGMMQVDLARLLELGKVTVGGLVDRLEITGHVERRPDKDDRRVKRVFITEQGFEVTAQMIKVGKKLNEQVLKGVSEENREITEQTLLRVKHNLKDILQAKENGTPIIDFDHLADVDDEGEEQVKVKRRGKRKAATE